MDRKELISAAVLGLLGIGIWWQAGSFPSLEEGYPGPSLFPRMIAIGLLLGAAWIGISAFRRPQEKTEANPQQARGLKFAGGLALVALYPILQPLIGFMGSLGVICLGIALLLGVKPWIAIASALATVLFIFITFEMLLGVTL